MSNISETAPDIFIERARDIATDVLVARRNDFISLRQSAGDVFAGAVAAGADSDTAREIAVLVHTTSMRDRIASQGGLLLGALAYFETRGIDG